MGFDIPLLAKGFDLSRVLSDDKHVGQFVCTVCQQLVALDAVVTSRCSHPFCRRCMESWAVECALARIDCTCPTCKVDLSKDPAVDCMDFGTGAEIAARPLHEAQPLAYRLLTLIQVACVEGVEDGCPWIGDYGKLLGHLATHRSVVTYDATSSNKNEALKPQQPTNLRKDKDDRDDDDDDYDDDDDDDDHDDEDDGDEEKDQHHSLNNNYQGHGGKRKTSTRPTLDQFRSLSMPNVTRGLERADSLSEMSGVSGNTFTSHNTDSLLTAVRGDVSPKKSPYRKPKTIGDSMTAASSITEDSVGDSKAAAHENEDVFSLEDLKRPNSPRWNANHAIYASPVSQKPRVSSDRLDATPTKVRRYKSELIQLEDPDGSFTLQEGDDESNSDEPPSPALPLVSHLMELSQSRKELGRNGHELSRSGHGLDSSKSSIGGPHQSNSKADWNMSINSLDIWNESSSQSLHMETVDEISEQSESEHSALALDLEPDDEETVTSPEEKSRQARERAEKLKKQANAKFNKGDFGAARKLYTEGINIMKAFNLTTVEDRRLISNMYSNRAVTFFREKDFITCLNDCDCAIKLDPTHDKSWIRKWRALIAMGDFEGSCNCINEAAKLLPKSKRIQEELQTSRRDVEIMSVASKALLSLSAEGLVNARNLLKDALPNSTNTRLIAMGARVSAATGDSATALELASSALRHNPKWREAVALRGEVLLLSGDIDKALQVLYEAYYQSTDCEKVKLVLNRCQRTQAALSQAESFMKKCKYDEAVDSYSAALAENEPLPKLTPLYSQLASGRANAYLLASRYQDCVSDCESVLNAHPQHPSAWFVRAEALISLGEVGKVNEELAAARRTWGADNPLIEEICKKADFETRVSRADQDLLRFLDELEAGKCDRLTPIEYTRESATPTFSMPVRKASALVGRPAAGDMLKSPAGHEGNRGLKRLTKSPEENGEISKMSPRRSISLGGESIKSGSGGLVPVSPPIERSESSTLTETPGESAMPRRPTGSRANMSNGGGDDRDKRRRSSEYENNPSDDTEKSGKSRGRRRHGSDEGELAASKIRQKKKGEAPNSKPVTATRERSKSRTRTRAHSADDPLDGLPRRQKPPPTPVKGSEDGKGGGPDRKARKPTAGLRKDLSARKL